MNIINKLRKVLTEDDSNPLDVMGALAKKMNGSKYMKTRLDTKGSEEKSGNDDFKPIEYEDAKQYITKLPCIIYQGRKGEHSEQKIDNESLVEGDAIVSRFAQYATKQFNSAIVFSDSKNYKASLFAGKTSEIVLLRDMIVTDGIAKENSYGEMYSTVVTTTNVQNEEVVKLNDIKPMDEDKAKERAQEFVNMLKEIEVVKPTKEAIIDNVPTVADVSAGPNSGDNLFIIAEDSKFDQPVPLIKIVNYEILDRYISPSDTSDEMLKLKNLITNKEEEIALSDIQNFYYGEYRPKEDFDTALEAHLVVKQVTGKKAVLQDVKVYTLLRMWDEFAKKLNNKTEALLESREHPAINEDDSEVKEWRAVVHLSYYDNHEDDNLDAEDTKKIRIKAINETQAVKYSENYIRMKALEDDTWKGAYIENIESIDEDE